MKRSHGVRPRSIRTSLYDRKLSKYGGGGSSSSSSSGSSLPNVLVMLMVSIGSFFAGTLVSWQTTTTQQQLQQQHACPTQAEMDEMISERVQNAIHDKPDKSSDTRFPLTVQKFATGMGRISKAEFAKRFDMGVPLDLPREGEEDVLLLYSNERAHPPKYSKKLSSRHEPIPLLTPEEATAHCNELHIVLTDQSNRQQCVALVPQYESFHIQKWLRVNGHGGPLDPKEPLIYVSRGYQDNGREKFRPPEPRHTRNFWNLLGPYLRSIDGVLRKLRPYVERVATHDKRLVVMVCNMGQSELLMNFVCSVKARGLDYSNVLVFATDLETKALAEGMGLTAFFDEINFGKMPSEAAHGYGDRRFVAMMMAKVFCVHMISMLGYEFLFQDVDIVWYQHPLEYFRNTQTATAAGFDIFFQDDGAHSTRYAPYSANSGFYYVRHNDRTQFFLTSILMAGDLILKTFSHQQALVALLSEHASLYGLRVKVLSRTMDEFPGGYQFHQKSGKYMKAFFDGEIRPYIFHMSWTLNKDNKLLYFRQMGEWYLDDKCIQTSADDILARGGGNIDIQQQQQDNTNGGEQTLMMQLCCHAEPLVSCHYRDKPSIIPCHDSPSIDKGKISWWKMVTATNVVA